MTSAALSFGSRAVCGRPRALRTGLAAGVRFRRDGLWLRRVAEPTVGRATPVPSHPAGPQSYLSAALRLVPARSTRLLGPLSSILGGPGLVKAATRGPAPGHTAASCLGSPRSRRSAVATCDLRLPPSAAVSFLGSQGSRRCDLRLPRSVFRRCEPIGSPGPDFPCDWPIQALTDFRRGGEPVSGTGRERPAESPWRGPSRAPRHGWSGEVAPRSPRATRAP